MAEIVTPGWSSLAGDVEELAPLLPGLTLVNGGGEVADRSPEEVAAHIASGHNWVDYCGWPLYYQEREALFAWGFARLLQALGVAVELSTLAGMFDFWGPGEGSELDGRGREIRYFNVHAPVPLPAGLSFRINGVYRQAIPAGSCQRFALETAAGGYYYGSWNLSSADYAAFGVSAGHEVELPALLPGLMGTMVLGVGLGMIGRSMYQTLTKGGRP